MTTPTEWTDDRLQEVLEEWHKRLALGAWVVGARFVPGKDLDPTHEADVEVNDEHRFARVRVMHPEEHGNDFFDQPWDVERAVVHELLHLHEHPMRAVVDAMLRHLSPAASEAFWAQYDLAREQMINTLARVLVNLKRENSNPAP